jgi:hemerythrin superfamily protein
MNAIELIKQDHETVDGLFQQWEESGPDETARRRDLVRSIVRELSVHAAVEEQILYPAMKDALPDGDRLVKEALDEHQEAKEVLAELDDADPRSPGFEQKVRSLIQDVRHHVQEEETELLPKLENALPLERLEQMGGRLEDAKKGAPTRPHPHAPSAPPANVVAGAVAGVVDRARDARRDRPAGRPASRRRGKAKGPVFHVAPAPDGGWRAEKEGSSRALARGDSKQEVVQRARNTARSQKGRLIIHKRDGRIQEERTYGPDPRRTRG